VAVKPVLWHTIHDFIYAAAVMFAAHFVFNINMSTVEYIQRYDYMC